MKIKLNQPIVNIMDNKEVKTGDEVLTLKKVMQLSILSSDPNTKISLENSLKRYEIGQKLSDAKDTVELTAEEITEIKKSMVVVYPIVTVGYACKLIEAGTKPTE